MTNEEIKEIKENGSGADLMFADLREANLRSAYMNNANLGGANLDGAKMSDASLICANFDGANLRGADLREADLRIAILSFADLSFADLREADLSGANLKGSDLSSADLRGANLNGANLNGANLNGANLDGASYKDTLVNIQCPEEGSFIAWKKLDDEKMAKLLIPEDAMRSSSTARQCRASKAIVLAIYDEIGNEVSRGVSAYDPDFKYEVGATVVPDFFDENRWEKCSGGIYFFITKKEAEEY